ncbi:hypothetical protein HAX54_016779 [Datura stramonium]|uniref:Uncharacterized protein n=1 Tax=Datura stramonium TaxID=4076 RepID=A0ABS8UKR9_DATST|nr:hypothetical protein [Datura stramonium]
MTAADTKSAPVIGDPALNEFPLLTINGKEHAPQNYVNTVRKIESPRIIKDSIPIKPIQVVKGVPTIRWTEAEVHRMTKFREFEEDYSNSMWNKGRVFDRAATDRHLLIRLAIK